MIIYKETDSPAYQLEHARKRLAEAQRRLAEKKSNPDSKASLLMIETDVRRAQQEIEYLETLIKRNPEFPAPVQMSPEEIEKLPF